MTRSGYSDGLFGGYELYRASVDRAINGKRGQAFLRELAKEMDAMDEKVLIADDLVDPEGYCCAVGVVCKSRGLDVSRIDVYDPCAVGAAVGIARSMAAEIEHENDLDHWKETPDARWKRMREWVESKLAK